MHNDASPKKPAFQPPSPQAEADVVCRLKQGDDAALATLLDLHWDGLLRFATRILGDRSRAEDVVQEAFVRLWEHRATWVRTDTLRPVLYRIVRNRALNEKRGRETFRRWAERFRSHVSDPGMDPLERTEVQDLRRIVRAAVNRLPERRREIFLLVRFHQMSYQEAATALDLSPQTVANQMHLAMKDLRLALGPHLRDDDRKELRFPSARQG